LATASSICAFTRATCRSLISGPITLPLSARVADLQPGGAFDKAFQEFRKDLLVHQHLFHRHADLALMHEAAEVGGLGRRSRSASSSMIRLSLPPSSTQAFLQMRPALGRDGRPTAVEPVKDTPLTSGFSIISSPTSRPRFSREQVTTLNTPGGMPASCRISAK
jgi:hypothetical protein